MSSPPATGGALYSGQEVAVNDLHYVAPPTVAKADDHYIRGVQAVRNRDYLAALHHFNKATFLAPNEPLPFVARAEAYTHLCDLKSAVNSYRKAVVLMKDPVTVQELKARLAQVLDAMSVSAFSDGQVQTALRYVDESLEEHYDPAAELRRSVYLIANRRHEEATTILASLIQKPEVRVDAAVLTVELHINTRRDYAAAKVLLETVLQEHGRHARVLDAEKHFDASFLEFKKEAENELDVEKLTKCVLAFPHDASLYMLRATALSKRRQYTAAVQDLFAAITASGGTNAEASNKMKEILHTIADELVEVNDRASALNYYTESLKWDEKCEDVLLARGDCHLSLEQHEDALRDYQSVYQQNRQHIGARLRLTKLHDLWGSALYNQCKYQLAEAEYSKGIQYWDQDPTIFYHRAQCRLMLKEPEYALRDLLSCRDLRPTDPEIANVVAQFCPPIATSTDSPRHQQSSTQRSERRRTTLSTATVPDSALDEPSVTHSASVLSHLASTRSMKASALEERFNPLALREFVKKCATVSQKGSAMVTVNPVSGEHTTVLQQQQQQGSSSHRMPPTTSQNNNPNVVWGASTRPPISRLDRVAVTKEAPIPKQYATSRRIQPHQLEAIRSPSLDSVIDETPRGGVVPSSYIPRVVPPQQPHKSKLSGARSSYILSASAPSQFMFASKLTIPSLDGEAL